MRPYWKGYLKLALVSCPIALHAACSTAERIAKFAEERSSPVPIHETLEIVRLLSAVHNAQTIG